VLGPAFPATLAGAQGGDELAFAAIFRDVQPVLLRYLHMIAPAAAEDVAAETWLQVVAGLTGFSGEERAFRAWLFTIGRHRAIDAARSRNRFRDKVLVGEAVPHQPTSGNPVEDEVLHGLSTRRAVTLVAGLSRDQAEVVALRIIAGLDTDAVARILRKSPGAVRIALHRGLRTLSEDPRIHEIEKVDQ